MENQYLMLLVLVVTSAKNESSKLPRSAANIANSQFKHRVSTSVVWWRSSPNEVTDFLVEYEGSVKTIDVNTLELTQTIAFRQAVLFIASYEEFSYFLAKMDTSVIIPSKVIALLTEINYKPQNLSIITQAAWDNDITDIILMNLNDERQSVEISTYYPYSTNKPCGYTAAVAVDPDSSNFFPSKFNNFNRCPFIVQANGVGSTTSIECVNGRSLFITGIFGDFITFIATRLNATMTVVCSPTKLLHERRLELLVQKEADMAVIVYLSEAVLRLTQLVPPHYFTWIVWCGPPRREAYVWAKVIIPLINHVSALLLATFLAFVAVLKGIHRFEPRKKKKSPKILWQTLAIFLGQTANYVSKSTLMNALYAVWIWFCLVVSIIYQGELVRGLQTTQLEPPLESLEDAIRSLDGYGGPKLFTSHINGTPWAEKFTALDVNVALSYIPEISKGKRFLFVANWDLIKIHPDLQCLKEPVDPLPMTIAARPRWGGAARVAREARRATDAGLYGRLLRADADATRRQRALRSTHAHANRETAPLDLVTLSTCLYGLAIMWVVCFIILCMEIIYERILTPPSTDKFVNMIPKKNKFLSKIKI